MLQRYEPPSLTARLLFKAVDRLSGQSHASSSDKSTYQPLPHQKALTGPASSLHQPQKPQSRRQSSYQAPVLISTHLPPRTRSLTPSPFEKESNFGPRALEQTQSIFFSLPDEVLVMIYEKVIGHKLIHIVRRQFKLGYRICESTETRDRCRELQCRGLKCLTGTYVQKKWENDSPVRLLQVCRSIYAKAIPLLYSSNVLDFDSMEGFISLSCALLPRRFDTIQSMKLDFRFDLSLKFSESTCFNDWPRWERTWRILFTMGSLQKLWVRISWPKEQLYDMEEKRYLEPLRILTCMEIYEVSLPPLKDKEKSWGKELPFHITRRA